jgi:LytR cell envelope-related transcriptional attenuator
MVWFAFSVQDQVEKYGAYVGIAAFFGLAVLSLLYFSQARELKRLREWAGRAPERARELEQRVVAQATATVARRAPGVPAAPAAKGGMAPPRRLAEMPAPSTSEAAAGAQATELADAVEAEPVTNGNVPAPPVGPGGSVLAGRGPENGAAPPDAAAEGAQEETAPEAAPAAQDAAADPPVAADGGEAPGTDRPRPEPPAAVPGEVPPAAAVPRATPAQRVGVTPRPAPAPLRQARPATATPRGGARRPAAPAARRPTGAKPPREGRSAGTIALLVGVAVLVLGGGAYVGSQLLGGDDAPPPRNTPAPPPGQSDQESRGGPAAARPAAETNVAVLNGTTFTGLAGDLADDIAAEGYERGVVETNTRDQAIQDSIVYYSDGFRPSANAVAKLLSIDAVVPLDAETQSLAPEADVVVLAGADQAP